MKTVRWCVIGSGIIAEARSIPALLQSKHSETVAVMDIHAEVAERVATKFGIPKYYCDAEEMLKSERPTAVYIATPVMTHRDLAMLALKYGVHVIMEKPIAMNGREAQEILDAFRNAGLQLSVGYMMGYHSLHRKARRMIEQGAVGQITAVRMMYAGWYADVKGAWRQNKALGGGGCIMDLAVHCMELFHRVTGDEIESCKTFYSTRTFNYEVEDGAVIAFRSASGIPGVIEVNFNIPGSCVPSRLEIYGTCGSLVAEGTMGQEDIGTLRYMCSPQEGYETAALRKTGRPKNYNAKGENLYLHQFDGFAKMLLSGQRDYSNADQAVKIQKLCDSIYAEKQ